MTTYNGFALNYSTDELKKMTTEEMTDITLLSETSPAWQALSEGDRKALQHLVQAAKILNNVCLQQDNPHNISLKQALEQAAKNDEQAALTLKMFNSLNGVSGLNGIDPAPICLFKGLTTSAGKFLSARLNRRRISSNPVKHVRWRRIRRNCPHFVRPNHGCPQRCKIKGR